MPATIKNIDRPPAALSHDYYSTTWYWSFYVHDRQTKITERVSIDSDGNQGNGWSLGAQLCGSATISADGRFVVFSSEANNLVSSDANDKRDVFIHDRQAGVTRLVSVDSNGNQQNGPPNAWGQMYASCPSMSSDGRYIAFASVATNLVLPYDTNSVRDVFLHDMQTGMTEKISIGAIPNSDSVQPSLSDNGKVITFASWDPTLVANDTNRGYDVFVYSREATLESILTDIEQLLTSGEIATGGIAESLTATLQNALDAQEQGNITAAANMLNAFINKVEAQAGKQITQAAADALIADAQYVLDSLN